MTPSVTYYGDPLEEASVFVRQYRGGQRGAVTDATGTTKVCLARPTRTSPYLLWARVGAMAVSPVFSCTPRSCKPINCTKASLRLDQRRLSRRRLKLSIATRCGKAALFDQPVKVAALDRKGNPRSLSSFFTPPSGRTFVVKLDPRRDRRLRIRFSGDPTFQLPAIVRTVKFARAGRKASRGRRAAG